MLVSKISTNSLLLFVVWQGIYDPGQTQQKDGDRGFILLPAQPDVLPISDASSDEVKQVPCFVIQNCQAHYSSKCPMYGTCQNNVVYSLFTSATLAFRDSICAWTNRNAQRQYAGD